MADINVVGDGKGGGGTGGGGGGPLTQACTYTYSPGYGNIIPGPQNINTLPAQYIGYPLNNVTLRVHGGTQAQSGDIMCSSYNTATQWLYIPGSENSGAGPLFEKGCCIARWLVVDNGGQSGGGGTNNPPLGLGDLVTNPQPDCPSIDTLQIDINGFVTFNGQSLNQDCCYKDVVGQAVNFFTVGGKSYCQVDLQESACPPIEAISLLDGVWLGIESFGCCTPEFTGDNNVWWDENNGLCKTHTSEIIECVFDYFTIEQFSETVNQIFGVNDDGSKVSLSRDCCKSGVVGFDVEWDSELNLCKQVIDPNNFGVPTINLNTEIIDATECNDLLISVKLYVKQPVGQCGGTITCFILPDNPSIIVDQIGVATIGIDDNFNEWIDLGARFQNVDGNPFNIKLVFQGLTDCCEYDIRIDNIRVDCYKEEDRIFFQKNKCVGFDLAKVIDNKKSWVYNVGTPQIGTSEMDNIIRERGDDTLLENFGFVNRRFAPSPDAQIPWRYTDYYEQSNVLEPHSKSVINSKELYLTFNMCEADKCLLNFYLSHDGLDDGLIVDNGGDKIIVESERVIKNLLQLEAYKNKFQEFWVRMIEQFVPATTIFVSGEKWCNNDKLICTEFEECDYDYEYVESEITVIQYGTDFNPDDVHEDNGGDVGDSGEDDVPVDSDSGGSVHDSGDRPINTDGSTIIPTGHEPSGNTNTTPTDSGGFNNDDPVLEQEVNKYRANVRKGRPEKEFI